MKCKGAIFDMDGVLFDTERMYLQNWNALADEYHVTLDSDFLYAVSGTNGAHMCEVVQQFYHVPDGSVIVTECKKRLREQLAIHVPIKKGVPETLQFLRSRGMKLAVASSSTSEQVKKNLKASGLDCYFDQIIGGEHVQRSKPAPDIFAYAARQIGYQPQECLVFEDSFNGVRAGHDAHCITIMIPDLIPPTPEIAACCAGIYPDFLEFLKHTDLYL